MRGKLPTAADADSRGLVAAQWKRSRQRAPRRLLQLALAPRPSPAAGRLSSGELCARLAGHCAAPAVGTGGGARCLIQPPASYDVVSLGQRSFVESCPALEAG